MKHLIVIALVALAGCQPPTVEKNGGLILTVAIVYQNVSDQDIKVTKQILKNRVDAICDHNPSIAYDSIGRSFRLELPLENDKQRFDQLLFTKGHFETLETYEFSELADYLHNANKTLSERQTVRPQDTILAANPLFSILIPPYIEGRPQRGPVMGYSKVSDTARVNSILRESYVQALFPRDVKFMWAKEDNSMMPLIAIRGINESYGIDNSVLEKVSVEQSSWGCEIRLSFKPNYHKAWARMTAANLDRTLAVVIDDEVYNYPRVNAEITGGRSAITGKFDETQGNILAAILNNGILPLNLRVSKVEEVALK